MIPVSTCFFLGPSLFNALLKKRSHSIQVSSAWARSPVLASKCLGWGEEDFCFVTSDFSFWETKPLSSLNMISTDHGSKVI